MIAAFRPGDHVQLLPKEAPALWSEERKLGRHAEDLAGLRRYNDRFAWVTGDVLDVSPSAALVRCNVPDDRDAYGNVVREYPDGLESWVPLERLRPAPVTDLSGLAGAPVEASSEHEALDRAQAEAEARA